MNLTGKHSVILVASSWVHFSFCHIAVFPKSSICATNHPDNIDFRSPTVISSTMSSRSSSPGSPGFTNDFPKYIDGDVLIKSGTGRSWKLHSTAIMSCSKTLAAMLSNDTVTFRLSKRDREEGKTIRWIMEMIPWEERQQDTRFRSFELQVRLELRIEWQI